MFIHHPDLELSTSENLLQMLRPDKHYTDVEAKVLDAALILHMEHGGGNNSTFTTRVVSSSGSDTYSTIAAAMSSLKGPKHGGANIKVMQMMQDIKDHVSDYSDEDPDDTVLLWPCKLFLFPLCLHPLRFQALYMGLALYMITTSFSY